MCKALVHVKKKNSKKKVLCFKIRSSESSILTIQLRIRVVPLDKMNIYLLLYCNYIWFNEISTYFNNKNVVPNQSRKWL